MEKYLLNGQKINNLESPNYNANLEKIDMDFNVENIPNYNASKIKKYIHDNIKEIILNKEKYINVISLDKRKSVVDLNKFIQKEYDKYISNLDHFNKMMDFDKSFGNVVAGVDEVGRGPLAGPIVAACVILDMDAKMDDLMHEINDSKKLTHKKRQELVPLIKKYAKAYSITMHTNEDIDNLGLAYCNNNIFLMALKEIKIKPQVVLSDGYYIKSCPYKNEKVIKGDSKSAAIACASILAKEYRDDLMREYDNIFKGYNFSKNVGYGSKDHIESIHKLGITSIHRKSFLTTILNKNSNEITLEEKLEQNEIV